MSEIIAFLRELVETSRERFKNPISRNFTISFLLYNWKSILILLISNKSIEERILFIKNNYTDEWCIIYPLLFAILYTLCVDFVMWWFDTILLKSKKGRKNIANSFKLHSLQKETLIVKAQLQLEDVKSRSQELYDLNNQIENLKNEVSLKNEALNNSQTEKNNLLKELNDIDNINFRKKSYSNERVDLISVELISKSLTERQEKKILDIYRDIQTDNNLKDLNVLIDKGLIFYDNVSVQLTNLGKIIAMYLINVGNK